jgi:hypothetical protein
MALRYTPRDAPTRIQTRQLAAAGLHHLTGDLARACDLYDEAMRELSAGPARAEILYRSALAQRGEAASRIARCEQALEEEAGDDDALAAKILGFLAFNRWMAGRIWQGLEAARAGLARAERVGDPRLVPPASPSRRCG